ncbi:MAG: amidohydrolase family protein [Acidobacteriota bacterium]
MNRRQLLQLGGATAIGFATGAARASQAAPVLDTHIHLFDPRRPGGVPWPEPNDPIYKPALPRRYARIAEPFGIVGAIAIEASPLPKDNDWVLRLIENEPIIVGFIGDLVPGDASFAQDLERLHQNPRFLGIRCGNLWNRDFTKDAANPAFIDGLRRLASAGLTMDSANPDPALIAAVLRISQQVPELRIVIDHLPHATLPTEPDALRSYQANLRALGANPRVYVKLSEIPVRIDGRVVTDVGHYRENLDALWEIFGEDRVLFGSDWPNSDHVATYAETFHLAERYVDGKGAKAASRYFWRNSIAAYRWRPRTSAQQALESRG